MALRQGQSYTCSMATVGGGGADRRPAVLQGLVEICGLRFARLAGPADAVAGVPATWVAAPATVDGASATLRLAAEHGLAVVARGAGTKLDWGASPERIDLMLDTGRLAGVWHHPPGELFAEVGAGTPLRAAQAVLARTGQRLPLDPPSPGATVGGLIATHEAGPLAHGHGTPADQLLGVSYVDVDGVLTHSADRGVARLLCGSFGALGVVISATFRVEREPSTRAWVCRSVWTPLEVHDLVDEVLGSALDVAAVEVDLPATKPVLVPRQRGPRGPGTLAVLVEGSAPTVAARAARLVTLLAGDVELQTEAPTWWGRYPFGLGQVALRITVPTADLHAAIYALRDAAGRAVPVRGSAGLGVVHAAMPGATAPERVGAILDAVRGVLLARGGSCVVVSAPAPVLAAVDPWGAAAVPELLRPVKDRFDPRGRLAPGRFFGL